MEKTQLVFRTSQWVQCRNEKPFLATICFAYESEGIGARIDCPHCARAYYLRRRGEWISDRPLMFLADGEVEEAIRNAVG